MRFAVVVSPRVIEGLQAISLPPEVLAAVKEALDDLETRPQKKLLYNPLIGARSVVEKRHDDFLWRLAFAVDVQDDAGVVWVTSVAINPM